MGFGVWYGGDLYWIKDIGFGLIVVSIVLELARLVRRRRSHVDRDSDPIA